MSDKERDKAFKRERARQVRAKISEHKAVIKQVESVLKTAQQQIRTELAAMPTDFQAWQLPQIQKNITGLLNEIGQDLSKAGSEGSLQSWERGIQLVDAPIEAGGIRLKAVLHDIDLQQLTAMRTFMTDRMLDVTAELAKKINSQIGLAMIGAQTQHEVIGSIAQMVEGGRGRAKTILRTEMGRAFSVASQERKEAAGDVLPGLMKQWRRSGKIHSRLSHDLADGQIVGVKEPFIIGGIKMMYPRDPKAPIKETINCGCDSLPSMAHWEVGQSGRQPFSDQEVALNPMKRNLDGLL